MPEVFNATLLNRVDAYRPGLLKQKGIGEVGVGGGLNSRGQQEGEQAGSQPGQTRDEYVSTKADESNSEISDPFSTDNGTTSDASSYMDNLCQTYTDRIKTATTVSNDVLEYLLNLS